MKHKRRSPIQSDIDSVFQIGHSNMNTNYGNSEVNEIFDDISKEPGA